MPALHASAQLCALSALAAPGFRLVLNSRSRHGGTMHVTSGVEKPTANKSSSHQPHMASDPSTFMLAPSEPS